MNQNYVAIGKANNIKKQITLFISNYYLKIDVLL